jgi:diguanylate cyclase (GGDEF)-like protein
MSSEDLEDLRRRLHAMTVLQTVTTSLAATLDPQEVLSGVLDSLRELVTCEDATVHLDESFAERHTVTRTLASGLVEVAVPLVARERPVGVLRVALSPPPCQGDVEMLELLGATAALALQNAELFQETQRLATTDPLTGLNNYRQFHALLDLEVQRARRMRYPVGMLSIDLDHFKLVNDQHGHPAGDRALQRVAELLRKRLRRTDILGRVGGEEFAVILPGDDLEAVAIVAEQLRKGVEDLPPAETRLTLSIGAAAQPPEALDKQTLIDSADRALYAAKREGRNQVRLCNPSGE